MRRIGVCEFSLPVWGITGIELAAKAGFAGMQLADCGGAANCYPFMNEHVRASYLEAAERCGIVFQGMHLHNLFHDHLIDHAPDSAKGIEARKSLSNGITASRLMNIPAIMVTVTNVTSFEQYDNIVDALKYAGALAKDAGVRIVVETDFVPERFRNFVNDIGYDIRLCFDTMNPKVYGIGEPAGLIEQYGFDIIDHFHVKDAVANERGYMTKYTTPIVAIGEGQTGFKECADVINNSQYDGWFISETFYFSETFEKEDFLDVMKKDAEILKNTFLSSK